MPSLQDLVDLVMSELAELERYRSLDLLEVDCRKGLPLTNETAVLVDAARHSLDALKDELEDQMIDGSRLPVEQMSSSGVQFILHQFKDVGARVQRVADYQFEFELFGEATFPDPAVSAPNHNTSNHVVVFNTLYAAVDRWSMGVDEAEICRLREQGLDFDRTLAALEAPWFRPDDWIQNRSRLIPLFIPSEANSYRLPGQARRLIREMFHAYGFGLWGATLVLARGCLERAVVDALVRLNRPIRDDLESLISSLRDLIPTLADELHKIRQDGNRLIHAELGYKSDMREGELVARQKVLATRHVGRMPEIVHELYSLAPPHTNP